MDVVYNLTFSLLLVIVLFGLLYIVVKKSGISPYSSRRINELEDKVEKLEKENK